MEQKRESFPNPHEEPFKPTDPDERLGRVMDELRHLLASMPTGVPEPAPPPAAVIQPPIPPVLGPLPSFTVETPPVAPLAPPVSAGSPLPSDQDFWNGNVLGWLPADSEAPAEKIPKPEDAIEAPDFLSNQDMMWASEPPPTTAPKEDASDLPPKEVLPIFENNPFSEPEPAIFSEVSPAPAAPLPLPDAPPPIEEPEPALSEKRPGLNPDAFQHLFEPAVPVEEPVAPSAVEEISLPAPEQEPVSASVPVSMPPPSDIDIKIDKLAAVPETIGHEVATALGTKTGLSEDGKAKPDNLINIACFVPETREADGQMFYRRLRSLAEKIKSKFQMEAVFIHSWTQDQVDLMAWEKSAALSGADVIYILLRRTDTQQFETLLKKRTATNTKVHLVYLDTLQHYNMYAGLLCDIKRPL